MKYIVYLTKNLVNNKIYIGVHGTENPEKWDFYLGDGCYANKPSSYNHCNVPFAAAVHKYGPKNFRRTVLKVFDTLNEALYLESILVDEVFIRRKDSYNITLGGGMPPILNKIVYQYDLNGNFVKEWFSIVNATTDLQLYKGAIPKAITAKQSCGNFFWSFEKYNKLDISEYSITKYRTQILVYNKESILLNEFSSISEAAKFYDIDPKTISGAISENIFCYGLIFIPKSKNIDDFFKAINNRTLVAKVKMFKYNPITGDYICEYNSIAEAAKDCGLKTHAPIIRAAKNRGTSAGYMWSYFKVDNLLKETPPLIPTKITRVGQYDDNDNLIKVWDIEDVKKVCPNFRKVCRGNRSHAGGYKWKYIEQ